MKRVLVTTILMIACSVVTLAASMEESAASRVLSQIFDEYHEFVLREYPESATFNGDHRYDSLTTDYSEAAYERRQKKLTELLQRAEQVDTRELTSKDMLNRDLFIRSVQEWIESIESNEFLLPLNQLNGLHLDIQLLADQTRFESDRDRACYLARLQGFGRQVDEVIALLRGGIRKKIVLPELITQKVLVQLDAAVSTPFDQSLLFTRPLGMRSSIGSAVTETAEVQVASTMVVDPLTTSKDAPQKSPFEIELKTVGLQVSEAYRRLQQFVRNEYLPASRKSIGMSSLPLGAKRYASRLLVHTTVPSQPEEVFQTGMREVERILGEMHRVKKKLEFKGTVEEFNNHLRKSEKYYYQSGEELLRGFDALLSEAKQKIGPLFGRLPKADCQIKELESFRAESAPQAYYNSPPENGSKPGYFYVNTYNLPARPIYTMTALTLHEAVPGHHLQVALAQEMPEQPWFRRQLGTTAFVEGWALYAERLGYEMGMYADPIQEYGALGFEMWRACRLVVDVGMHMKNWTREEAIDFMKKHIPNSEVDIANEIDRYIADPGQACAYKIGQLSILRLRTKAEKELGSAFKLDRFHDAVLREGAIPLQMLEANVTAWIEHERNHKD